MTDAASWFVPDWPLPPGVRALQTTRVGGVSGAPWAGFNLGDHVGDEPAAVAANRARLAAMLPAMPVWLAQVHGVDVARLDALPAGAPAPVADAAVARAAGRVCAVMTADCLPLLLCDRDGTVVAAAHAGWRGLCAGVIEATVAAMAVRPAALSAWLGPAIGPAAFEVGDEVRAAFVARDAAAADGFVRGDGGRWFADLYRLARQRLAALGVPAVHGGGECTWRQADRYFSYRRDGVTGRMATLIWREA
ncbi:peptidoglycan editing factor PgeF [Azospira restricta]|uniref:Purine nucleoside phosphorylase n=1 Tax=Azospira restricta TaxID=404405 RepID=A0A974PW47_9RHOO|nr:peptidoglycan editing factor PgeF [Azospira restricta]QRJ62597.1 peptidoglycan editing factor PgeF [Azospira restricta]